ncbi:MAG: YcgN family cysteine cluster protein [Alphaproteobacteria bacterium]|nr:YcgN family cysteine cluster protein [Alphaproteobacteria bacterium]
MQNQAPFWQTTALADMDEAQWEAVCDGCAKCCLVKLQDEPTGELAFTNLACRQLELGTCRCKDYDQRTQIVSDCVKLTKDNLAQIDFMPPSCAYRLLNAGKDLPDWHPLVSGTPDSVVAAGMSVHGRVIPESEADEDLENHVVLWPFDEKN